MNPTNLPGFTADISINRRSTPHSIADLPSSRSQAIIPQARIGGGLGLHWPSWCEVGCATAAALCIAATEGVGVAACIASEVTCLAGCKSFLGWGGGVVIA